MCAALDDGRAHAELFILRARLRYGGRATMASGIYAYRAVHLNDLSQCRLDCWSNARNLSNYEPLKPGMRIEAVRVDTVPLGVDTPADLERAREMLRP